MPPFQQWFVELVSMLSNILVGVAAIIGLAGLSKWRSETIGKARFEIAQSIIRLTLQFRDEFRSSRNPFTFRAESADRKKEDNESPSESLVLDERFARSKRLERLQKTIQKLEVLKWEAEAILSEDDARLILPFMDFFKKFRNRFVMYFDNKRQQAQGLPVDNLFTLVMEETVNGSDEDALSKTVDQTVEATKKQLMKYIPK